MSSCFFDSPRRYTSRRSLVRCCTVASGEGVGGDGVDSGVAVGVGELGGFSLESGPIPRLSTLDEGAGVGHSRLKRCRGVECSKVEIRKYSLILKGPHAGLWHYDDNQALLVKQDSEER